MNRESFELFVERVLVPRLRPGQTVVLDNLSGHNGRTTRQLICDAGCWLAFLPDAGLALHLPDGHDLNPIEKASRKLKQLVAGVEARTVQTL